MFVQHIFGNLHVLKNKYGTKTGVAELLCEQLDGDCSRKNDCSKEDYIPRNGNYLRYGNSLTDSDSLRDGHHPRDVDHSKIIAKTHLQQQLNQT